MLEQQNAKRGPGRPRKESDEIGDVPQTRRRRKEGIGVIGRRLAVNETELDLGNYEYRWVNDIMGTATSPGPRVMALTRQDDWDIVKQGNSVVKDDSVDLGDAVSVIVGVNPDGSPMKAYLCRKPRKFYEEDLAAKQRELDKQLKDLRSGKSPSKDDQADYVPLGGISMS